MDPQLSSRMLVQRRGVRLFFPSGFVAYTLLLFCLFWSPIANACSDAFARLYDRRMLPPLSSCRKKLSPPSCVNYFCPIHLSDRVSLQFLYSLMTQIISFLFCAWFMSIVAWKWFTHMQSNLEFNVLERDSQYTDAISKTFKTTIEKLSKSLKVEV